MKLKERIRTEISALNADTLTNIFLEFQHPLSCCYFYKSHYYHWNSLLILEHTFMYLTKSMTIVHRCMISFQWFYKKMTMMTWRLTTSLQYEYCNKCPTKNKNHVFGLFSPITILSYFQICLNLYVLIAYNCFRTMRCFSSCSWYKNGVKN